MIELILILSSLGFDTTEMETVINEPVPIIEYSFLDRELTNEDITDIKEMIGDKEILEIISPIFKNE